MKKIMMSVLVLSFAVSLLGCSTVKGVGDDIKTVGGWITNGADHVQDNMKRNPSGS